MRLLFLGDVVGRSGREAALKRIPELRAALKVDFLVLNGENAAGGFGITDKIAREFFEAGVDCITTGNHVWDQKELVGSIDHEPRILRPLNYPDGTPGRGASIFQLQGGRKVLVMNVMARLFMDALDLDEFFAQLLVAEGFTNLEEVAYVEQGELLAIDGVDEGTADELQARARDYLEAQNAKALESARALGIDDTLVGFEGLTPQMLEALAKDGVKTLEDFATCADWELAGGWTTVNGQRVKDEGLLEPFEVSLEDAQSMVMTARVMLGWVDPEELNSSDDAEAGDDTDEEAGA